MPLTDMTDEDLRRSLERSALEVGELVALLKRARDVKARADAALSAAQTSDHRLAILANYGDIALSLLPALCDALGSKSR